MRIENYKGKRDGWNLAFLLDPTWGIFAILVYVIVKSVTGLIRLFQNK